MATTLEREKARLEKEIGEEVDLQLPQEGGTTATITLLHKGRLLVAWVGDSRALLGVRAPKEGRVDEGGVQVVALTKDHNLADEAERSRLVEAGGKPGTGGMSKHVSVPGVEGSLKVTRSLGDSPFHKGGAVSSTPEVRYFALSREMRFVLIASDGIWDHLSNEQEPSPLPKTAPRPATAQNASLPMPNHSLKLLPPLPTFFLHPARPVPQSSSVCPHPEPEVLPRLTTAQTPTSHPPTARIPAPPDHPPLPPPPLTFLSSSSPSPCPLIGRWARW